MTWRMANSLETLRDEINKAAPNRSTVSDGGIGDAAHASRTSDHNPWVTLNGVGIVRARDFTNDPSGGLDCNRLATFLALKLAEGKHPALGSGAYVIWNKRIISRDRIKEMWRPYSGSNAHQHHLHLSVATSAAGFDSRQSWGWPEGDEMSQYADQLDRIEKLVKESSASLAAERKARVRQAQRVMSFLRTIRNETQDKKILARLDDMEAALMNEDDS